MARPQLPGGIGTGVGGGGVGSSPPPTGSTVQSGNAPAPKGYGANSFNVSPWLFPPSDYRDLEKYGSVALPAIGASAIVLQFIVQSGRAAKITAVGIDFTANGGAAFTQNVLPFQLTFNLLLNGRPAFFDWAVFNYLPGSVSLPDIISGIQLREGQTVAVQVTNNSLVVTTQFVAARLQGYFYSNALEAKILGNQ